MSTRCKIAKVNEDGTIVSVHCQVNGFVQDKNEFSVAFALFNSYNTEDSINTLFVNKDLHSLEPLEFYDRLEVNPVFENEHDWFDAVKREDNEYIYLFKNGKWYVNNIELTKEVLKKGSKIKSCSYLENDQRENENLFQWQKRLSKQKK